MILKITASIQKHIKYPNVELPYKSHHMLRKRAQIMFCLLNQFKTRIPTPYQAISQASCAVCHLNEKLKVGILTSINLSTLLAA